jgi:hypothetical protein
MRGLGASELLEVWDRGLTQSSAQRALGLLAAACADTSPETLAALSIGKRDALLLTLREQTFGPEMAGLAVCSCGEQLELSFTALDIRAGSGMQPAQELFLDVAGYELCLRLPNSLDLLAAIYTDLARNRCLLLERCVLSASRDGTPVGVDRLPAEVVETTINRLADADPQADVWLAVSCPSCGTRQRVSFDILAFFWSEIEAWALRVLREVHTLAWAYGWHERDILALSSNRRQSYLEMVGA